MHFPQILAAIGALAALCAIGAASPAPIPAALTSPAEHQLEARQGPDTAVVNMYAGNTCNGETIQKRNPGGGDNYQCWRPPFATRSIQVSGR